MKKLAHGSLLLLYAATTYAAPHPSPDITTMHDWQGAYFGLTAGATWGTADPMTSTIGAGYLNATNAAAVNQAGNQYFRTDGFTSGIEAGYNWVFKQYFAGLEADLESIKLGSFSRSNAVSFPTNPAEDFVVGSYVNINWLATLRPRIGLVMNETLVYITGGLGVTKLNANFYYNDSLDAATSGSINEIKSGYIIGFGTETSLTKQWSAKIEYLYTYFNRTNATDTGSNLSTFPDQVFSYSTDLNGSMLRLGLNYKLNI